MGLLGEAALKIGQGTEDIKNRIQGIPGYVIGIVRWQSLPKK